MADVAGESIIEARGLRKEYGATVAVDDVSFRVARGEVVGFLGPNGAGKSTTMKMLTGYLRPTRGAAVVGGIPVAEDPLGAQRKIGYLPESAPLYDEMMVIDFLHFVGELRGVDAATRQTRLRTVCQRCGLADVLGKDIGQLSKGYRQRVGLAQALLHDPDVLILDEPTSGLDPNQIVEIRQLIRELGKDKTILLSTHILPEVQASCTRVIIIHRGSVVADDSTAALTGGAGALIQLVVASANGALDPTQVRARLAAVPGVRSVEPQPQPSEAGALAFLVRADGAGDPRADLFRAAVAGGFVLLELHREKASLEQTFRSLTKGEGLADA
ncbi:MAG: ATP-binding cassette domain-containing protein [Deltaproteobacteria bacterium]|nr:ATP-binding cassette domain-containing protein [Deltaproteobacteria bacterium]